jgi:hypothetical protein
MEQENNRTFQNLLKFRWDYEPRQLSSVSFFGPGEDQQNPDLLGEGLVQDRCRINDMGKKENKIGFTLVSHWFMCHTCIGRICVCIFHAMGWSFQASRLGTRKTTSWDQRRCQVAGASESLEAVGLALAV